MIISSWIISHCGLVWINVDLYITWITVDYLRRAVSMDAVAMAFKLLGLRAPQYGKD